MVSSTGKYNILNAYKKTTLQVKYDEQRSQTMSLRGILSAVKFLSFGVPQGSKFRSWSSGFKNVCPSYWNRYTQISG